MLIGYYDNVVYNDIFLITPLIYENGFSYKRIFRYCENKSYYGSFEHSQQCHDIQEVLYCISSLSLTGRWCPW